MVNDHGELTFFFFLLHRARNRLFSPSCYKTCQFTFGSLHSRDEKPKVILIFSKGWLKNWYLVIHLINFPRIFFSTKLLIFHRSNPGYTRLLLIKRLRYFCFKTKTFGVYSQGKFDTERSVIFLLHSTLDFFFFASK